MIAGLMVAGLLLAGADAPAASAGTAGVDGKAALERLKSLAGEWRGHVVTEDGPEATVVYAVTAGGTAVTESLFPGTEHAMLTVYHLEGNDLVLTHYCAMGNQPRMKLARAAGTDPVELRFDFAGGANVDPATDMHMHSGRMTLRGANRIEAEWAVYDKGKQAGANKFFLDRVKTAAQRP
jgi:hypothetical protein